MSFAWVHESVVRDDRLTLRQLRVLLALLTFADKDGRCHPKREALADLTGYLPDRISTTTTELAALGYLEKIGNGGRGMPPAYLIKRKAPETLPESETLSNLETIPESETLSDSETLPESGSKTLPESGSKTLPESGSHSFKHTNEQTSEQTSKALPRKKSASPAMTADEMPEVNPDLADEYLAYRKAKKAPLTPRAWKHILGEIEAARMEPEGALGLAMARGWQGFEAAWVRNSEEKREATKAAQPRGGKLYGRALEDENARVLRAFVDGSDVQSQPDLAFIEGIFSHEKH